MKTTIKLSFGEIIDNLFSHLPANVRANAYLEASNDGVTFSFEGAAEELKILSPIKIGELHPDTPIRKLELSSRVKNALKAADIETLSQLMSWDMDEIRKFRNFGNKSRCEVEKFLENIKKNPQTP